MANSIFKEAAVDVMPLCAAVIPWGFLCGSLALQAGLTPAQAQAMSVIVFAGAVQLSGTAMIAAAAPLSSLLGTALVISSRHLLYSANFRQFVLAYPLWQRMVLAFLLTDEMYALAAARKQRLGIFSFPYALITGVAFYLTWNLSTWCGIVLNSKVENIDALGLEFAVAATFIALLTPLIKNLATTCSAIASGLSVIALHMFNIPNPLLLAALTGMIVGLCCEIAVEKPREARHSYE